MSRESIDGGHVTYHFGVDLFDYVKRYEDNYRNGRKTEPLRYAIVHCVSACLTNGRGFARDVTQRYGKPPQKPGQRPPVGSCVVQPITSGAIIHVVTKASLKTKPSAAWYSQALNNAANQCANGGYRVIFAPLLGAGLDKMPIDLVVKTIQQTLGNIECTPAHVFVNDARQWELVKQAVARFEESLV